MNIVENKGAFEYYLDAFKNYATFSGRASRRAFWFFNLFHLIIILLLLTPIILLFIYYITLTSTSTSITQVFKMIMITFMVYSSGYSLGYVLDYGLEITGWILIIYALATIIPSYALGVRRLHDIGKSGWWQLLLIIPFLGAIILIIFFALPTKQEQSKYDNKI